ncbi:MAG: pseudouridine synthase [Gammaproteobacteria bacterium]|nr:pseudouridine synthase [Gammaproteobacteria bacterium]
MSDTTTPQGERLQKVLANAGFGSRREIEGWIKEGRVKINGKLAKLGDRVTGDDLVQVGNRRVRVDRISEIERRVIVYNKPEGEVVTRHDPGGRPTAFRRLPKLKSSGRWIAVGRLDINSSGLMLFTTDGELANRLMHPSKAVEREYAVRVLGDITQDMLNTLVSGVELEDGPARFEDIVESGGEGANRWFHVVIMEGRNREVRRMWEAVGARVNRLKRVRYGPVMLGDRLHVGKCRDLDQREMSGLLEMVGLEPEKSRPSKTGSRRLPQQTAGKKANPKGRKRRH